MKIGTGPICGPRALVYEYCPNGIPVSTPMNSQRNEIVAAITRNFEAVFTPRLVKEWKK